MGIHGHYKPPQASIKFTFDRFVNDIIKNSICFEMGINIYISIFSFFYKEFENNNFYKEWEYSEEKIRRGLRMLKSL